jgi:hypothetical protein
MDFLSRLKLIERLSGVETIVALSLMSSGSLLNELRCVELLTAWPVIESGLFCSPICLARLGVSCGTYLTSILLVCELRGAMFKFTACFPMSDLEFACNLLFGLPVVLLKEFAVRALNLAL